MQQSQLPEARSMLIQFEKIYNFKREKFVTHIPERHSCECQISTLVEVQAICTRISASLVCRHAGLVFAEIECVACWARIDNLHCYGACAGCWTELGARACLVRWVYGAVWTEAGDFIARTAICFGTGRALVCISRLPICARWERNVSPKVEIEADATRSTIYSCQ